MGNTPLHMAAEEHAVDVAAPLIRKGANLEAADRVRKLL